MIFGPYPATVARVVDGDTIDLDVELGFDLTYRARVRLFGINAPEIATVDGRAAAAHLRALAPVGALCTLVSHGWDKYGGRVDGDVVVASSDGRVDLATAQVQAAVAKPWDGKGPKP